MEKMTVSEIGSFPESWSLCRVDSLFSIQQGKSVSKVHRIGDNQKPFLRTKNISWGQINVSNLDYMHFTKAEESKLELHEGDLLLCEGGDVGRAAIWGNPINDCFFQNHLHRLRVINPDEIIPEFFLYWFWYAFNIADLYIGSSNLTTIPNMSQSKLGALVVPKPEIREQRMIARILLLVQTAIEQQERLIILTRELKTALMDKLFTEGFRNELKSQKELGLLPTSWEVIKLKDAVEYIDYGYSAPIPKINPKNGIKIVSTADITRAGDLLYSKIRCTIAPESTTKRLILNDGDVLFNWRNSAELIGKTTIFEKQIEPHIFASFILRIKCNEKKTHNYYLKHILNHYREQEVFIKLSRRAVNQANYNRNEIFELLIPYPKIDEQYEIANKIEAIEAKLHLQESRKNSLIELFHTLMNDLMTGRIRINNVENEEV
jgi:type I restriction enzyme, S subunit